MLSERPMDWTHRLFNRARSSTQDLKPYRQYCGSDDHDWPFQSDLDLSHWGACTFKPW